MGEFYKIKMIDRASGYVDPDEDFQLQEEEDQDIDKEESKPDEDDSDAIQVGKSHTEEPTETPVAVADDESVASRTRSQTATDERIAARTRQALGSDTEMSVFADVKDEKTLNKWLHEIAFVTSTMSDPDEPQCFQETWWDPDLDARDRWFEAIHLKFKKMLNMGVWRHVKRKDHPIDCTFVACRWAFNNRKCSKRTLSIACCLVAKRMSLTQHLLLFKQSM